MVYWWEYSVNVCGVLGAWCGCTVCISGQGVWASGGQGVWVRGVRKIVSFELWHCRHSR